MSSLLEHRGEGKMGTVVLVSILASMQVFGSYNICVKSMSEHAYTSTFVYGRTRSLKRYVH